MVTSLDETALDPGVAVGPFLMSEIVEIAFHVAGEYDRAPWVAIVRLSDGRWLYAWYFDGVTADGYWSYVWAANRGRLWWWACTDEDRERFTAQLTQAEQEAELVECDRLMESEFSEDRELGEKRMLQLHALKQMP
jgi:hypothetical protein